MFQKHSECTAPDRIILMNREVYKLPHSVREIQVLSGIAWLTLDQQDIILQNPEKTTLQPSKNAALISALNNMPLVLAIWRDSKIMPFDS
ncbi:MAG: hypothetical protein MUE44_32140 [Oscillatoriaceae cyanobacterium Prado104]|jgi:hypothetical protein|nr:hypothetical protein [Oscillatoriaceae cyanobacterium Prado104]